MSAFIVDNSIINRIVSGLDYATLNNDPVNGIPRPYGKRLIEADPHELGQALRDLNEYAVKQRYPDWITQGLPGTIDENGELVPYEYTWQPYPSIIQFYKDIGCLVYQCTEGDAVSDPLYLELQDYYNELAHTIARRLPDYDRAEWG